MPRRRRVSPAQILDAASVEFAARGFAGARVDRIARRARVNKAMLYYHFRNKQELYRTLLRDYFSRAARRVADVASGPGTSVDKLDRVVDAIAQLVNDHAEFPAIMLREVAEGGAHLDADTLRTLVSVPRAFFAIVEEGVAAGAFRPVHPIVVYFSTLAPLIFFLAAGRIRSEISAHHLIDLSALPPQEFVRQLQDALRRAVVADAQRSTRTV